MNAHYPTDVVAASPDYVLNVIRDQHRQNFQGLYGTDGEPLLDFDTSVAHWCADCDLAGWPDLGLALNNQWDIQCTKEQWRAVLTPPSRRTLRDVCELIAKNAVRKVVRPARFFGRPCQTAGAFLTVRWILQQAGADVAAIAPSTELAEYARRHLEVFLGPISRLAPNRLPAARIHHPLLEACAWAFLLSVILCIFGSFRDWRLVVVGLALNVISRATAARAVEKLPSTVELGELRTFRDLAVAITGPGYCLGCGYNLTGNISGVCPECGRAIEPDLATVHACNP